MARYCVAETLRHMSRYHLASASVTPRPSWFRGTKDGDLSPNAHGIIWLALDKETALSYGPRLLEVTLTPSASLIDLRDLSTPVVREMKDMASAQRERTIGYPIPDRDWARWADFGMLESNAWAVPLLLDGGVDGILVSDSLGTAATPHESLALLDISAVSSWTEVTEVPGP